MSSNTDLHQDKNGGIAFIYQNFLEGSGLIRVWYSNCKLTDVFWHLIWWIKDMYAPNHFRCNNAQNFKKTAAISLQKNITKGQNHIIYNARMLHCVCLWNYFRPKAKRFFRQFILSLIFQTTTQLLDIGK